MFEVTLEPSAKKLLDEHFLENGKADDYLRLYVRPRQSSKGRTLALKPDSKGERDLEVEVGIYTFVISRHLAAQIGNWAKIDVNEHGGFLVTAEKCFNHLCDVSCTMDACAS